MVTGFIRQEGSFVIAFQRQFIEQMCGHRIIFIFVQDIGCLTEPRVRNFLRGIRITGFGKLTVQLQRFVEAIGVCQLRGEIIAGLLRQQGCAAQLTQFIENCGGGVEITLLKSQTCGDVADQPGIVQPGHSGQQPAVGSAEILPIRQRVGAEIGKTVAAGERHSVAAGRRHGAAAGAAESMYGRA